MYLCQIIRSQTRELSVLYQSNEITSGALPATPRPDYSKKLVFRIGPTGTESENSSPCPNNTNR